MIISHKYKFIFLKPKKVAGTSVEINLAKHCGPNDVITPISQFNPQNDENPYFQPARNYKENQFYNHVTPKEIKEKIGDEKWNEYFKFTIVRNPYDQVLSRYFWSKNRSNKLQKPRLIRRILKNIFNIRAYLYLFKKITPEKDRYKSFEKFVASRKLRPENINYYFDQKGSPICDFYIRYENLEKDYERVCAIIGISYEKLPLTKNKTKPKKDHYSQYYNDFTKQKVRRNHEREIIFFNYEFKKTNV